MCVWQTMAFGIWDPVVDERPLSDYADCAFRQIKACVIPGNAFAREEHAFGKQMQNNGLPSWIPKNTSQVGGVIC